MRYNLESMLPINAFKPRGGRGPFTSGMTLEGGGGSWNPVNIVEDAFSSVGDALASIDPGPAIGDALASVDPGPAIGQAGASVDNFVNDNIPGGWYTVAAAAITAGVAGYASGAIGAAEALATGATEAELLAAGASVPELIGAGTTVSELVAEGISIPTLLTASADPIALIAAGVPTDMVVAGLGSTGLSSTLSAPLIGNLLSAGASAANLLAAGTPLGPLLAGGASIASMAAEGVGAMNLLTAGASAVSLFAPGSPFAKDLSTVAGISGLYFSGVNPTTLLNFGATASNLVAAGSPIAQVLNAAANVNNFYSSSSNVVDILNAGATPSQAAQSAAENGNLEVAENLKVAEAQGYDSTDIAKVVDAGIPVEDVATVSRQFTPEQVTAELNQGFSGETVSQFGEMNYTPQDIAGLKSAGYNDSQIATLAQNGVEPSTIIQQSQTPYEVTSYGQSDYPPGTLLGGTGPNATPVASVDYASGFVGDNGQILDMNQLRNAQAEGRSISVDGNLVSRAIANVLDAIIPSAYAGELPGSSVTVSGTGGEPLTGQMTPTSPQEAMYFDLRAQGMSAQAATDVVASAFPEWANNPVSIEITGANNPALSGTGPVVPGGSEGGLSIYGGQIPVVFTSADFVQAQNSPNPAQKLMDIAKAKNMPTATAEQEVVRAGYGAQLDANKEAANAAAGGGGGGGGGSAGSQITTPVVPSGSQTATGGAGQTSPVVPTNTNNNGTGAGTSSTTTPGTGGQPTVVNVRPNGNGTTTTTYSNGTQVTTVDNATGTGTGGTGTGTGGGTGAGTGTGTGTGTGAGTGSGTGGGTGSGSGTGTGSGTGAGTGGGSVPVVLPLVNPGTAPAQPGQQGYIYPVPDFGHPNGLAQGGMNPGWMNQGVQPYYKTTNDVQSQYYWGGHPYTPTYADLVHYNDVGSRAPNTPWGIQNAPASMTQPLQAFQPAGPVAPSNNPLGLTPAQYAALQTPSLAPVIPT